MVPLRAVAGLTYLLVLALRELLEQAVLHLCQLVGTYERLSGRRELLQQLPQLGLDVARAVAGGLVRHRVVVALVVVLHEGPEGLDRRQRRAHHRDPAELEAAHLVDGLEEVPPRLRRVLVDDEDDRLREVGARARLRLLGGLPPPRAELHRLGADPAARRPFEAALDAPEELQDVHAIRLRSVSHRLTYRVADHVIDGLVVRVHLHRRHAESTYRPVHRHVRALVPRLPEDQREGLRLPDPRRNRRQVDGGAVELQSVSHVARLEAVARLTYVEYAASRLQVRDDLPDVRLPQRQELLRLHGGQHGLHRTYDWRLARLEAGGQGPLREVGVLVQLGERVAVQLAAGEVLLEHDAAALEADRAVLLQVVEVQQPVLALVGQVPRPDVVVAPLQALARLVTYRVAEPIPPVLREDVLDGRQPHVHPPRDLFLRLVSRGNTYVAHLGAHSPLERGNRRPIRLAPPHLDDLLLRAAVSQGLTYDLHVSVVALHELAQLCTYLQRREPRVPRHLHELAVDRPRILAAVAHAHLPQHPSDILGALRRRPQPRPLDLPLARLRCHVHCHLPKRAGGGTAGPRRRGRPARHSRPASEAGLRCPSLRRSRHAAHAGGRSHLSG